MEGCLLWGVSAPGGSAVGGVCSQGGVCSGEVVSQHALRQTPLLTESQTRVKTTSLRPVKMTLPSQFELTFKG